MKMARRGSWRTRSVKAASRSEGAGKIDLVFDDELSRDLTRRYGPRLATHRPEYYLMATSPDRADQRNWMNEALRLVPEPGQAKLWGRLTDDNHFLQTYNELATIAILQGAGFCPHYEVELGGLTPDIAVLDEAGRPAIILEVANRMRSNDVESTDHLWRSFRDRVRHIPAPWVVMVGSASPHPPGPGPKEAKRLAQDLAEWLVRPSIAPGDQMSTGGLVFTVLGQLQGSNADLVYPRGGDWVNSDRDVAGFVNDKVTKYTALARTLQVPLVVVLGADPRLPLDLGLLQSAMRGQLSLSLTLDPLVRSTSSGPFQLHATDKPPAWDPALSAVAWLEPGTDKPGKLTLFPNVRGTHPHRLPFTDGFTGQQTEALMR